MPINIEELLNSQDTEFSTSNYDDFASILEIIRNPRCKLTKLSLIGCSLTTAGAIDLAKALACNTTVTELDVGYNEIGDEGAKALAGNKTITMLDVSGNWLGSAGAEALAKNKTITALYISFNQIGAAGAWALSGNKIITELDLSSNWIGDAGARALAENKTITVLYVSYNQIGATGTRALADNKTITELDLSHNEIGAIGARALSGNKIIIELDLSGNRIGAAGARALSGNKTITVLGVSGNRIGSAGASALADNTTIIELDVGYNGIRKEGVEALAGNKTITELDVTGNRIGEIQEGKLKLATRNNLCRKTKEMHTALQQGNLSLVDKMPDVKLEQFKESGLLDKAERMFAATHPLLGASPMLPDTILLAIFLSLLPKRWLISEKTEGNLLAGVGKSFLYLQSININRHEQRKKLAKRSPVLNTFIHYLEKHPAFFPRSKSVPTKKRPPYI